MYTGHALDIEGFITIWDITLIGLVWVGNHHDLKRTNFCSCFNSSLLDFDHA